MASVTENLSTEQVNADSRAGRAEDHVKTVGYGAVDMVVDPRAVGTMVDPRVVDSVVGLGGKVTVIAFINLVHIIKREKVL